MDRVDNGSTLCELGEVNGWVTDRVRVSVTGDFGVPGENYN